MGVYGTFHHVSKKHLPRYCAEFDFRWNGKELKDSERRDEAVKGAEGSQLRTAIATGFHAPTGWHVTGDLLYAFAMAMQKHRDNGWPKLRKSKLGFGDIDEAVA